MDFAKQILANRQAFVSDLLRRVECAFVPFHTALECFLATLFQSTLPADWRERWHRFVAQQEDQGFHVVPESVGELEDWMEDWARFCKLLPASETSVQGMRSASPSGVGPQRNREEIFDRQLAMAERNMDEIRRILEALGGTLDATTPGQIVDVDAEVIAIEASIWQFNAALDNARATWLRADLSADANRRLMAVPTPAQWNLPAYTDELQAQQACRQEALVNERLRRRNLSIERANVGTNLAPAAETPDGIDLGGAVLVVTKDKSRWIAYKSDPVTSQSIDSTQSAQQRTHSASDGPQTLHGVDLAAAVIRFILHHRPGRRDRVLTFPSLAAQMRQPASPQLQVAPGRSAIEPSVVALGLKSRPQPKPAPAPKPPSSPRNSTFNEEGLELAGPGPVTSFSFQEKVRHSLDVLDPKIGAWWRANSVGGEVRSRIAAFWQSEYYSYLTPSEQPVIVVNHDFDAGRTAQAIIAEVQGSLFAQSIATYYRKYKLGKKLDIEEFRKWQQTATGEAAHLASVLAELYYKSIATTTPAGDLVVTINDISESGFDWNLFLSVLPLLGYLPIGIIILKLGGKEIKLPKGLARQLKELRPEERKAVMAHAAAAKTEQEAKAIIERSVAVGRVHEHHIATNKNWISTLRGGPWSPEFEKLFRKAGMTLEDAANKVIIPGHYGPHPEAYHREIFRRLTDATRGKKGDAYKQALLDELKEVANLAKKPGTTLNRLLAE